MRCSHGATTGRLDEEGIFYLRTRGLTERQARGLMLTAFARDVIDTVRIEAVQAFLDARITSRLRG